MPKLTTDEFIKKAREVHGDKYDYSKVEYVDSRTKVCIICQIHGEFWKLPKALLIGKGCPLCVRKRGNFLRENWTKEKFFEVAQKCHSKSELRRLYPYVYSAALKNRWLKDYTWFETLWAPKWDRDTCYFEAKKYDSRGSYKNACPTGYSVARKNGWLEDYIWFKPARKQVPRDFWTYETCFQEAKKYKTKENFRKGANRAALVAWNNGWMDDYTWLEPAFRWTRELCEVEARKFKTKTEFQKGSPSAYVYARINGLLNSFDWFEEKKKPNGYWTKERCEEEARKYKTKGDFLKGCGAAHSAAVRNGWLDDYNWLTDPRIDIVNGKIDSVYVYIFEETKTAYVGRTLMRRQKQRDREHIFNLDNDNVACYAKKHHIPVPSMKILEYNLTLEEGLEREDYWRQWYEQQGYAMLNRGATGIGKGSLGGISHGKWNRKTCREEALKYKSSSEFESGCPSAYSAARINGWLKDYTWFAVLKQEWNEQTCFNEAKKYKTRYDFYNGSRGAYIKALKTGWINKYTWLRSRQTKPSGYWDNYEHCFEEAKKYKNRRSFQKGCNGAYNKALKNGWLNDYTWFEKRKKTNGYWNQETCYEEAKKYRSRSEFGKHAVRAYGLALENGWLDDYTWFEKLTNFWTYEACKEEASKYEKRGQLKKGCIGAYTKSRINGWLDDFFPKK